MSFVCLPLLFWDILLPKTAGLPQGLAFVPKMTAAISIWGSVMFGSIVLTPCLSYYLPLCVLSLCFCCYPCLSDSYSSPVPYCLSVLLYSLSLSHFPSTTMSLYLYRRLFLTKFSILTYFRIFYPRFLDSYNPLFSGKLSPCTNEGS